MTVKEAQQFVEFILEGELTLTDKERLYVKSVYNHSVILNFVSKKQSAVLQKIYTRATGGGDYAN